MKTPSKTFLVFSLCTAAFAWLPVACTSTPPINESTGEYIDDSKITNDVTEQIVQDANLKTMGVKVQSLHGVVTLTGIVDTTGYKNRAGQIAASVPGVRQVNNEIGIKQ